MPFFRIIRRRIRTRRRSRRLAPNKKAFLLHKEAARTLAHARLEHFARFYAAFTPPHIFVYRRVSIRNQRTRWGSCSRKGNLNFSYKLALLPPHLADYLIVHELCHLGQFNHSPAFWVLVALAIPDFKCCREELKNWHEPKQNATQHTSLGVADRAAKLRSVDIETEVRTGAPQTAGIRYPS